ncbi:hypothetical protein DL764_007856 [Monosporascus ibericus]|uniref:Amidoligase enzyme n=1 Tax=Monosporascus ibericus TaxID=155417 RepID=A0A4Q4SZ09_9PEZI|nr:hypothetical protein DL764_007856 [Monosporascus ibericus]
MAISQDPTSTIEEVTLGIEFEFMVDIEHTEEGAKLKGEHGGGPPPLSLLRVCAGNFVKEFLDNACLAHPVDVSVRMGDPRLAKGSSEVACSSWIVKYDASPVADREYTKVVHVLDALKNMEYVKFNDTCGLHVHVGRGILGFPLKALQKLGSLLFLGGEEVLDQLHPPHRINDVYFESLRSSSRLVLMTPIFEASFSEIEPDSWVEHCCLDIFPGLDDRVKLWVALLWKTRTVDEFCFLISDDSNYHLAYSFKGLESTPLCGFEPRKTIEFRQAEGDLTDQRFVLSWIDVVSRLTAWAVDVEEHDFETVVKEVVGSVLARDDAGMMVQKLLGSIGVSDQVISIMVNRARQVATVKAGTA